MSEPFRYRFRVRYAECDAQKVVFNSRYGDYVDIAAMEFFRALGYGQEMVSAELDFQLVRQTTQWRSPARYDDVVEASVHCLKIGNTSFTLATTFRRAGEPAPLCEVETVYVLVDAESLQKRPVDALLRERLEQGAAGRLTSHAGD